MDRLSGSQAKQLQSALLAGFSFDDLSRLSTFELNERLDSIVPPGPMSSVTFDLIMWAEQQGADTGVDQSVDGRQAEQHGRDRARPTAANGKDRAPPDGKCGRPTAAATGCTA